MFYQAKKSSVAPSITTGTFSVIRQRTSVSTNITLALFLSSQYLPFPFHLSQKKTLNSTKTQACIYVERKLTELILVNFSIFFRHNLFLIALNEIMLDFMVSIFNA